MMRNDIAKKVSLGGLLAAVAVVIMNLVGIIPVATYVCPALCILILKFVQESCGNRIAWAWYMVVSILSLLLAPDKEAAAVFLFLGYYPIVKPKLDASPVGLLLKVLLFNATILVMYWLLMNFFGVDRLLQEFEEMGMIMTAITLVLGNMTFFMLDYMLGRKLRFRRRG